MKLLHTSDWHLGKSLYDFPLLEDQRAVLEDLLSLLDREGIDVLVLAGDVYDRPVPAAAAVELYDSFLSRAVRELGVAVVAVAGNHDSASRLEFGSSLYASSGYHVCGQARETVRQVTLEDDHGPVDFWLMPYLQPAGLRALLPDREIRTFDQAWQALLDHNLPRLDPARRNVAVAHGFFSPIGGREDRQQLTSDSEINVGGMDIADSGCFAPFDYAALGHLHAPQRAGSEVIRYAGSPLKYSLSEETQKKSYTLVELGAKGEVRVELLPLTLPRDLRTVTGSLDQLLEPSFHQNQNFDDYVFAYLADEGALYPMEKLRKLFPHLLGLRLLGGEGAMPQVTLGGGAPRLSPQEMFARFFREIQGYDMPEESTAFLRETLELARKEAEEA